MAKGIMVLECNQPGIMLRNKEAKVPPDTQANTEKNKLKVQFSLMTIGLT